MAPVRVGLLGLGTVGQGTVSILLENAEEISRRVGRDIQVTRAAVRDVEKARKHGFAGVQISNDPSEVVEDPEIDVVVEAMGGEQPALDLIMRALALGKHVVTANKALIAVHGNTILAEAHARGLMVLFESAVAGGIPIIKAVREGLAGNHIHWLAGIINGTSNFILTEMRERGADFNQMLAEAQALGYAEADPTFDIEGIDAAHKLTILASLSFGMPLRFEHVYTEGISAVSRADITYAQELGYVIKHLAIARRSSQGVELRVHPTLIPERRLLANVNGVMNAVLVDGDAVGSTLYYGAGAGGRATGSAVVADLVDVARKLGCAATSRVPALSYQPDQLQELEVLAVEEFETSYFLRLTAQDRPGVMADITAILGAEQISIEAMVQKEPAAGESTVPIILLTNKIREGQLNQALKRIVELSSISGEVSRLRVEELS